MEGETMYKEDIEKLQAEFLDWNKQDLFLALQESRFDSEKTRHRILNGNVSKWDEVKKTRNNSNKSTGVATIVTKPRAGSKKKSESDKTQSSLDNKSPSATLEEKEVLGIKNKTSLNNPFRNNKQKNKFTKTFKQPNVSTSKIESRNEIEAKEINARIMELNKETSIVDTLEQGNENVYHSKRSDAMSSASILVEPPTPKQQNLEQNQAEYCSSVDSENNIQAATEDTDIGFAEQDHGLGSNNLNMINKFQPNEYCLRNIPEALQNLDLSQSCYYSHISLKEVENVFLNQVNSGQFGSAISSCVARNRLNKGNGMSEAPDNKGTPEQYYDPYGQPIFN